MNAVQCETFPSRGTYTSTVLAQPDVTRQALSVARIKLLVEVTISLSSPDVDGRSVDSPVCKCCLPWETHRVHNATPCPLKLAIETTSKIVLPLAIVEWMNSYSDAYPGFQKPPQSSGYEIISQTPEHKLNLKYVKMGPERQLVHEQNIAGNHVINVRGIGYEVVTLEVKPKDGPTYAIVIPLPKCL